MRSRRPLVAWSLLVTASLGACATPSSGGTGEPLPSIILSPQHEAAQSCPNGGIPGPQVRPDQVGSVLDDHVPHELPPSDFGLAAAWGPVGGSATAGAVWVDPRCRVVRVVLDPNQSVGAGPQVGDWTLTSSQPCVGGLLRGASCLEYRAEVDGGTLVLSTIGLAREEGDAVANSIPI
ncbi:MAG TPA: hypothetical protein VNN79_08305 [Actinomycetota bacterium]|nr:hypothetical protein [Actinomycetota bacterium]